MASTSAKTPTLKQFDICMPFEFIKKCSRLSSVDSGISWTGNVRDATDDKSHQNYKNSKIENTDFEEWSLENLSENIQIADIKTRLSDENMLLMTFSKVHLQVLEGRCGFCLFNVQKDDSVSGSPTVVSNKGSSEVKSMELHDLTASKLISPSSTTPMVDYVGIENDTNTFDDDLTRRDKNLDSLSVDSNITADRCYSACMDPVRSDDLSKKDTAGSVSEKQPCLEEISSNTVSSLNPFSLSDSVASPLKENLDENFLGDKTLEKTYFPTEIDAVHKLQEFVPSTFALCQEKDSCDLSGETSQNNGKSLPSPVTSLTQESEIKVSKKRTCKPNPQFSKENKTLASQTSPKITKVNDTSVIPPKRYKLRGVKIPKYLIEEEKNSRHHLSKNSSKNQNLKSTKDSEDNVHDKEFHGTKDKDALLSDSDNPFSSPVSSSVSKKRKVDRDDADRDDVDNSKTKRRKRNNTRVVECRYCKKMFCDYTGVDDHVKKFHTNEVDFLDYVAELKKLKIVICNKCNMTLHNRYLLQEHENNVHSKVDSEICGVCGKKYKNIKSLRNHIRFVHDAADQAHLCHLCPAKFKWAGTLKQHIQEIHEGILKFSCPTCSKEFFRKSQLNRHVRIHGSDASKRITCALCDKGFWFENNYLRHMKSVHQPQSEAFHCSYCGKGFSQKYRMVVHVQHVHLKIHTYTCKICKMGFTRSKAIQVHMAQVHNETDFVLPDKQRSHFKFNRTAEDLLYCHYCNESFYYKAQVVEHIHKEHSFPFQCDQCKQGFVFKKFLDNHLRQAHGVQVEISDEDENNDAEDVLKNLLELKSESAVSPKCIAAPLENSEGIPAVALLSPPPNAENYEDLLTLPSTDNNNNNGGGGLGGGDVSTPGTSLLFEVAKDGNTVHYYIQHGNGNDKKDQVDNNQQVFEDIASLLLVAEQASYKESLPMISEQAPVEVVNEVESENAETLISPIIEGDN